MVTVYVSNLGTDEYTVDGTADNIQINQSLAYANTNGTSSAPITVYLRGPYTYEIAAGLLAGNNTILTGDSTAKLKLKNSAGWVAYSGATDPIIGQLESTISNFECTGFEIDGNDVNQPSPAIRGQLYYVLMWFVSGANIRVHDMYLHDSLSDGLRADRITGVYYYNNRAERMGHEACYLIRSNVFEIYGNNTLIKTNSAYRLWNTGTGKIHDNIAKPYALTSISGNPGIQIEHSDINYPMQNIEVYSNTLTDCWGEGMWIIEYGTGGQASSKGLYIHDNVITSAGRITTIDYNSGIAISGWNGARIENNVIKNCYNVGILAYDSPSVSGSKIYCTGNTITGTKLSLNSNKPSYSGYGVANPYTSNYTLVMSSNVVSGNVTGDYLGVTYGNDVPTTVIPKVLPSIRINENDELVDYYIDGWPSYVNQYPIKILGYGIDTDQSIGTDKPPGFDGWTLGDFGSDGTSINFRCYGLGKDDVRRALASWKRKGRVYVEKGEDPGWQVSGIVRNHSSKQNLDAGDIILETNPYEYDVNFYCDSPFEETVNKHNRARKLTYSGETWSSDNCYAGNILKNPSFEEWSRSAVQTWESRTAAASVDFECVGISEDLEQYCAVASSGTDNRIQISANGNAWTIPSSLPANINIDWKGITWGSTAGVATAGGPDPYVLVSSDNFILVSSDGYSLVSGDVTPPTEMLAGAWVAVGHTTGTAGAAHSEDGDVWTAGVTPTGNYEDVCYILDDVSGTYRYVACGDGIIIYSDDGGASWTDVSVTGSFVSIEYANDLKRLVAVASTGQIVYSDDFAVTWNTVTAPSQAWNEVKRAEYLGLFIVLSTDGGPQQAATSPTGTTWTLQTVPYGSTTVVPGGGDIATATYTSESDYPSNVFTSAATAYSSASTSLELTKVLPALTGGNIYRLDQVSCQLKTLLAGKIAYMKVTVQAASLYGGVETTVKEWTNNTESYIPCTFDCAIESATAETVTLRYYMKTSDSNYRAAAKVLGYKITTESTSAGSVTYNYNQWSGLAVSEELGCIVAVSQTGTGNCVMNSTNAETWILGESASDSAWKSACFYPENLKFVSVGSAGAIMTSEDYGRYTAGSWDFITDGQSRSETPYEGSVNLMISGDGVTEYPGMSTQPVQFEAGASYSLSGYVQKVGSDGSAIIDIYAGGEVVLSLEWTAEGGYTQLLDTIQFEIPPSDAVVRCYASGTPSNSTEMDFDKLCLQKLSDFDIDEIGTDITTTGTVDTIPDISIEAMGTLAGSVEGRETAGEIKTHTDPANVGSTVYTSYQLQDFFDYTIVGAVGTKYRIDKVGIKGCVASAGATCGSKIEVYFGTVLAGTYTFSATTVLSSYTTHSAAPALTCAAGESITFKYYLKSSSSSVRAYIRDATSTITEILETPTVAINAGISIYNTTDPLTVMKLCNKICPGIKITINANGTGSMRYSEDFSDTAYQSAVLSRSGDSYLEDLKQVHLTGSLVWELDSLHPITGIPYVIMDIVSGIPKLQISTDNSTWYDCDSNTLDVLTSERVIRELDNITTPFRLYGKTKYYLKLSPASGSLDINYMYMFTYLITMDAEHPVISPTGDPETFAVLMTNDVPCIINMRFPDKHWTV